MDPTALQGIMERVVTLGCECLAVTPTGSPSFCGIYHTLPPDDCGDFLIAWIDRIYPTKQFPAQDTGPTFGAGADRPAVAIKYRLVRDCWPGLRDDAQNPFPPREDTDSAALDLAFDGIQLFCCYMTDLSVPQTSFIMGNDCSIARVEALVPDKGRAGMIGWTGSFTIEFDSCVTCPPAPSV